MRLPERAGSRQAGFTLVELMVTVLVVALLTAIAVPGYRNQVVKTQRSAAKACLAQYAQFMERYYTTQLTYVGADPDLGCAVEDNMNLHYSFGLVAGSATATGYRLAATPTTRFAERDKQCGTLTLDQAGTRGVSSGDVEVCW